MISWFASRLLDVWYGMVWAVQYINLPRSPAFILKGCILVWANSLRQTCLQPRQCTFSTIVRIFDIASHQSLLNKGGSYLLGARVQFEDRQLER